MPKEIVPQLCEKTGLSQDYYNEVTGGFLYASMGRIDKLLSLLKKYPIKHYEIRYNPNEFKTDFSNPRISLLNKIGDDLNLMVDKDVLTCEKYLEICHAIYSIIFDESLD